MAWRRVEAKGTEISSVVRWNKNARLTKKDTYGERLGKRERKREGDGERKYQDRQREGVEGKIGEKRANAR